MARKMMSVVRDGWANLLTGMGVLARDRRTGASVTWNRMEETNAEHLYGGDDLAAKIVNLVPDTALQKGITVTPSKLVPKELVEDIEDYLDSFDFMQTVNKAWKWARLYGGAGIIPVIDDGADLNTPLIETSLKSCKALNVLHRWELVAQEIEDDVTSRYFGLPRNYLVSPRTHATENVPMLHASRVIRIEGEILPRTLFVRNHYWNDSVLNRLYNVLRNYNLANDAAASMVEDFNVGVMKLRNLGDILQSEGGEAKIRQRIEIMNLSKSVLSTILIDSEEEEYENKARQTSGLPELLDRISARLVGATHMPATVLFGVSPSGGLSGQGQSENRDWYDHLVNQKEAIVRKPMTDLMRLLLSCKDSPTKGKWPEGLWWDFVPLWQMDEAEVVAMRKIQADTDAVYLDRGVLSPYDVAQSRFGGDVYSIETIVDVEAVATFEDEIKVEEEGRKAAEEKAKLLEVSRETPDIEE